MIHIKQISIFILFCISNSWVYGQVSALSNGSVNPADYLGWNNSVTFPLNIRHNNNIANSDINFWTRNLQRMSLTDGGLLGLGVTAPALCFTLQITAAVICLEPMVHWEI